MPNADKRKRPFCRRGLQEECRLRAKDAGELPPEDDFMMFERLRRSGMQASSACPVTILP
jgi:hypothetical protein